MKIHSLLALLVIACVLAVGPVYADAVSAVVPTAVSESQLLDQVYANLIDGHQADALTQLERGAEEGLPRAQTLLGLCYRFGRYVKPDAAQARHWLELAAKAGNRVAQYHLGLLLVERADSENDLQLAFAWWTVAAEQGDQLAKAALKELDYRLTEEAKQQARETYADIVNNASLRSPAAATEPAAHMEAGSLQSGEEQKIVPTAGIELHEVTTAWVANREAGNLFVIRGAAINRDTTARSQLRVVATLLGAQGQVLAQASVPCGNPLSDAQLAEMPFAEIQSKLSSPFGETSNNLNVPAGQALPFTVVFRSVPPDVVRYTVVGSSLPAASE